MTDNKKTGAAIALASVLGLTGGGLGAIGLSGPTPPDDFTRLMAQLVLDEARFRVEARVDRLTLGSPTHGGVEAPRIVSAPPPPQTPPPSPDSQSPPIETISAHPPLTTPDPPIVTDQDFEPTPTTLNPSSPPPNPQPLIPDPQSAPCPPTAEEYRQARKICAADPTTSVYTLQDRQYDCTTDSLVID